MKNKEKGRAVSIALLILLLCASCGKSPLTRKFEELDCVLSRQKEYTAAFEAGAAPLRDSLRAAQDDSTRWAAAYGIYSIYKNTQMDSALVYLRMMHILSEGKAHEQFLSGIEASIPPGSKAGN